MTLQDVLKQKWAVVGTTCSEIWTTDGTYFITHICETRTHELAEHIVQVHNAELSREKEQNDKL